MDFFPSPFYQHIIIFKNPFWLSLARKGSPTPLPHSRKLFQTCSDWWVEETTIIPPLNDMSGVAVVPDKEAEMYGSFCVFKTEPKNTCLRCRLGAISNNRAPRFSRWEYESLWILFSRLSKVPGDQRRRVRRLPRGILASSPHPAVPSSSLLWVWIFWVTKDTTCAQVWPLRDQHDC